MYGEDIYGGRIYGGEPSDATITPPVDSLPEAFATNTLIFVVEIDTIQPAAS